MEHYPNVDFLKSLALEAGSIMLNNFCLGMEKACKSENDTPLTVTDVSINELVIKRVSRAYPAVRVIGEEADHNVDDAEYCVLVDPMDGTIPFCHGIPISTFVVSVVRDQQPLSSVIYDPFQNRMWHAEHKKGSFLNGKPIRVSTHSTLWRSNIHIMWWKNSPYNVHGLCAKLMDAGVTWTNTCSIAYHGGLVASGEFEATIFPTNMGWETAAMQLIAEEAGGNATNIFGDPLRYGPNGEIEGHIISNGYIHDQIIELAQACQ